MWNLLNPDNSLMQVINKVIDMVLLSLVWAIFSMTIVGFGPATVALYYTIVKNIRRERGSAFKEFFHAVKESWKVSLIVGILMLAFAVSSFFIDIPNIILLFTGNTSTRLVWKLLSVLKITILVCIGLYVFPLISRYQVKVINALLTSFALATRHFGRSVLMVVVIIGCAFLVKISPLFIIFLPSLALLLISFLMEPVLRKLLPAESDSENLEGDHWYLE